MSARGLGSSQHLGPERLARLAEGGAAAAQPGDAEHLAACTRCMSTYAELVTLVTQDRAGLAAGATTTPGPSLDIPSHVARWALRPRALAAGVALAAGIAAIALIGVPRLVAPAPPERIRRVLADAMGYDSEGSLLYARDVRPRPRGIRGTGVATPSELAELAQTFATHPRSADTAFWLIAGSLATDQLHDAEIFLREARTRFPNQARFANLAAILAYKQNDPAGAEATLRASLEREATPVVLYNLALLLQDHAPAEAVTRLGELRRMAPELAAAFSAASPPRSNSP